MRRVLVVVLLVAVAVGAAADAAAAGGRSEKKMKLKSPEFAKKERIPEEFTCDGEDVPPPLRWKRVPDDAVELAITLEDPDAPDGTFLHWVAWGLDPDAGELTADTEELTELHPDFAQGDPPYLGPCPPSGDDPHRYRFKIFALDEPVDLDPGAALEELREAMEGAIVAKAKLVGRYGR